MSPWNEERAREITCLGGWVKTPASLLSDSRLSLADRVIWLIVGLVEFHFGQCVEPAEVLASVACVSDRQIIRSRSKLIGLGLMGRERAVRKGAPDRLWTIKVEPVLASTSCIRCHADRPVNRQGICSVCRKNDNAEREVTEFIARHGPAPLEIVWLGLKGNGSKSSQKAIQRAYLKGSEIYVNR